MIKIKNTILFGALFCAGMLLWAGCSDDFLKEKKNYSNLSPDIYNDFEGASMRLQNLYLRILPNANDGLGYTMAAVSNGFSDIQSQATEEFTGLSWYVDPTREVSQGPGSDWFHVNKATNSGPWGNVRNCNDFIENVTASTLTDIEKRELLGQAYFLRAWQYYLFVKTYGGVPIIDKVQATDVSQAEGLSVPRATTKECVEFICNDLQTASEMLPATWGSSEFGRVTSGAALALAGRVRLLYASPLFNRADKESRWQDAYDVLGDAISELNAGGFGLAYLDDPGINASGFSKMFSEYNSKEAVFVILYNDVFDDDASHEIYRNNTREQRLRPYNASGTTSISSSGGAEASQLMVDLFPMADGKRPGESVHRYNELTFFENRDPRFYRTFAFPGVYWRFEGDASNWQKQVAPYKGSEYVLWNYVWYNSEERRNDPTVTGFPADNMQASRSTKEGYRSIYIRKRSNDFDLNPHPVTKLYVWPTSETTVSRRGAFGSSASPHMEMRYAEVLLNYAEAACGIGLYGEAIEQLVKIRMRAGYSEADARAVFTDIAGDRGRIFGAILYERQIELAYEGKRFDDMRRWLLWDGGTRFSQIDGAPASWTLTGFGGNTCAYLGVTPFNGTNRNNFELAATATAAETAATPDPIKEYRPAPLDLRKDLSDQFAGLSEFYRDHLVRAFYQGDPADNGIGRQVLFQPNNYIIGLTSGAQNNNQTLEQTIGWRDVLKGNVGGTFDPLAE